MLPRRIGFWPVPPSVRARERSAARACRFLENRSHLDRRTTRFRALAPPRERIVQIRGVQYPKTAHVFFGLGVRSVSDEQVTIGLRAQRLGFIGRFQTADEVSDASSDHSLLSDEMSRTIASPSMDGP